MKSTKLRNSLVAWTQRKVVGVAQNHMGTGRSDLVDRDALDGSLSADGHESRRFDLAVRRQKKTATRRSGCVAVRELKLKLAHEKISRHAFLGRGR